MLEIEKNIKEFLTKISFPRLSGTLHEEKAFEIISNRIKNLGLNPTIQNFKFSPFYSTWYPKISFLIINLIIVIFFLNIKHIIFPIILMIISFFALTLYLITRKPETIKVGKVLRSQNLHVQIPSKASESLGTILFFCHVDSKGQTFNILNRIRIIRTHVFTLIPLIFIIILKNYIIPQFSEIFLFLGMILFVINCCSTILFLFNFTNNKSPGSIDDGSGIVVVYELLKFFSRTSNKLNNYDLWFVFTGAEEQGTMGIRFFYNLIKYLDKTKLIIFNFDAIAKDVFFFPSKHSTSDMNWLTQKIFNNDIGLAINKNPKKIYFGSHSDGYFLKKKGLKGFGIGDMKSYKYIHTINDKIDKINVSTLKKLIHLIINLIKEFDIAFSLK
ncbi:MAG: M28 family metallopeptidase [Promethearchaeota archaeon]